MVIVRLADNAKIYFVKPESAPPAIRVELPRIWGVLDRIRATWRSAPRRGSGRFVQWITLPGGRVLGVALSIGARDQERKLDTIIVHDFKIVE